MGTILHRVLLVTSEGGETSLNALNRVRNEAIMLGLQVTPVMDSGVNSVSTFVVMPSGSKIGWSQEEKHTEGVFHLEKLLRQRNHAGLSWCEVLYGADHEDARVRVHAWMSPQTNRIPNEEL